MNNKYVSYLFLFISYCKNLATVFKVLFINGFAVFIYMHHIHTSCLWRPKDANEDPEIKQQIVMSYHVGAEQ